MILSLTNIFKVLFLFLSVGSLGVHTDIVLLTSFPLWLSIDILFLILIILLKSKYFNIENSSVILPIKLFVLWNVISILRGTFVAENYWEWKNLTATALVMLIPIIVYVATNKDFTQQVLRFWYKYGLISVFIFLPFINHSDFLGRYLVPVMFLLLVFPLLPFRWKIITLFFTFLVFSAGFDARSNIIRFSMAGLLGSLYYFRFILREYFLKLIHFLLISMPIILLLLGSLGIFNVFKMDQYIGNKYTVVSKEAGKMKTESLTADSRTFIYVENIQSAIKNDYVLEGRTPAQGYDSQYFGGFLKWTLKTGKMQRFSSEVSILNIFTWNGLIGAVLYFLVFLVGSYLAVYKSNSLHMKIIGLFVAFRWSYAFVEDFTKFDIQYVFLWMLIAMCYSVDFRKMSDKEFTEWVQGLVPKIVYGK